MRVFFTFVVPFAALVSAVSDKTTFLRGSPLLLREMQAQAASPGSLHLAEKEEIDHLTKSVDAVPAKTVLSSRASFVEKTLSSALSSFLEKGEMANGVKEGVKESARGDVGSIKESDGGLGAVEDKAGPRPSSSNNPFRKLFRGGPRNNSGEQSFLARAGGMMCNYGDGGPPRPCPPGFRPPGGGGAPPRGGGGAPPPGGCAETSEGFPPSFECCPGRAENPAECAIPGQSTGWGCAATEKSNQLCNQLCGPQFISRITPCACMPGGQVQKYAGCGMYQKGVPAPHREPTTMSDAELQVGNQGVVGSLGFRIDFDSNSCGRSGDHLRTGRKRIHAPTRFYPRFVPFRPLSGRSFRIGSAVASVSGVVGFSCRV